MIIIDPATAKAVIQLAVQVLKDEETRKRILAIALIPVISVVMILSMAYYILTNPIEFLKSQFGNDTDIVYAQNLQNEYGYIGNGAVIDITGDCVDSEIPLFIIESGKILANDPNSREKSNQEWSASIVVSEAKGAWAFWK